MLAREEGRRMGYQEGLSMGRRIGYDEGSGRRLPGPSDRLPYLPFFLEHQDDDENVPELGEATSDEERNDPRSHGQLRQQPYVNDCVARSSSPTLITECAPNRRRLYVRSTLPCMRRHFLSASTRLPASIIRHPPLVTSMNQRPFTRYRSALAQPTSPSASQSTTDGSQEQILVHLTSTCHPRTHYGNLFPPHPVLSRPKSRIAEVPNDRNQPQSRHLSSRAIMLIRRPFHRPLFRVVTHPRSHPVLRLTSRNMIW